MINLSGSTGLTKIIANSAYIGTKGTYNSLTSSSNGLIDFPTNGISIYRDNGTTLDPWGPIFPLTAPSTTVAIATTTLNQSGVNGATTSITVASSSGLPATPFLAMFGTFVFTSEAFKVTNVSGTTWTIVRSANGLSASSPANGSTITVANWALVDASNISTITTTNGGLYFSVNQGASGVNNLVGLVKIAPTTPYNVVVGFLPNYSTASTYFSTSFGFSEAATGKLVTFMHFKWNGSNLTNALYVGRWNSQVSLASLPMGPVSVFDNMGPYPLYRMGYDGTNITFDTGTDGINWRQIYTEAKNAFLTTAPDLLFFGVDNNSDSGGANLINWTQTG